MDTRQMHELSVITMTYAIERLARAVKAAGILNALTPGSPMVDQEPAGRSLRHL